MRAQVSGDQRTCAYEKERCLCEGHVRYGDGEQWTEWRDVEESIMCTNQVSCVPCYSMINHLCIHSLVLRPYP